MKTIMIHEMKSGMNIPKGELLTFDDGLYTQYAHARELPNRKIFFISTNIICDGEQSSEFITAPQAHKKAFSGNFENYMTISQIQELHEMGNEIGGHSHFHSNLTQLPTLVSKVKHINQDTELMLEWFSTNLGFRPTSFCFPYNYDMDKLYNGLLKKHGFVNFYGSERINLNEIPA